MGKKIFEKNKIYITGLAGMLGYGIYSELEERAQIVGVDIIELENTKLPYQRISLYEIEEIEKNIVETKPDILIHTAALINVEECERNPEEAEKLNVIVTKQLANICNKYKIKMVYISTDAVFDGENSKLYTEEDMENPLNVYGKTKLAGEACVLKYPQNLVFRTNIYGINIQKKQSFGEWIYYSLVEGKTLNLFTDIDFSPILVNELAELIYRACEKELCGLYHACGTGCITKYDFGIKLKDFFKIETGRIHKATSDSAHFKAQRSKHMGMSNNKLCNALNVEISTPQESIEKFYCLIKGDK